MFVVPFEDKLSLAFQLQKPMLIPYPFNCIASSPNCTALEGIF